MRVRYSEKRSVKVGLSRFDLASRSALFVGVWIGALCWVGCDDNLPELKPMNGMTAGVTSAGVEISGGTQVVGGTGLGGAMGTCEVSCDETSVCESLECRCPDGRFRSFDGCISGCCWSAAEDLERVADICEAQCAQLPPPECSVGETRCLEGSSAGIQRCTPDGEWTLVSCSADEVCELDQCLPLNCATGQTRCLSPSQIAECVDGSWTLGEMCDGACANGICQTVACAQASAERSYLGCEYMTLELPNSVTLLGEHAPVAVVLTNPSPDQSAYVTIYSPEGQPTPLIAEQTVSLPVGADVPRDLYMDQVISSEVRDAAGQLVDNQVMRADQAEIPPGGIGTFLLPSAEWPLEGSLVKRVAHRVVSDLPVGAYQFAPYCCNFSFSNDASMLIPTSALGQEYVYLGAPSLRVRDLFTGQDFFTPGTGVIVATRDQTEVRFSVPQAGSLQPETDGRLRQERGAYIVTLNQQETLLLRLNENPPPPIIGEVGPQPDLTGAFITADQPIAVFSGHECSYYPSTFPACDHLEEQLFPVDTWGNEFLLIPPKERGQNAPFERIYWKIVAQRSGTRLALSVPFSEIDGAGPGSPGVPDCGQLLESDGRTIALNERGYCEFSTKNAVALTADDGVMVMGIISGQESVNTGLGGFGNRFGDPSIFLVPPARQARRDYAFLTPATYSSDFATFTFAEGTTISLDGNPLDLSGALPIPGVPQKYIHVELTDGAHKVEGSAPFSIMVMAYDDFVSYAFTGGLNLSKR